MLLKLRGVSYEWNDTRGIYERPVGTQIGFIAQNIAEVFPERVSKDQDGYLQTAYGDYDPVIVEAIRALQDQINTLSTEVIELRAQLAEED